jgi:hypothetical protein
LQAGEGALAEELTKEFQSKRANCSEPASESFSLTSA